jgi:hypothetical protein
MQKQDDDPSNPPGPSTGQGEDKVMVKTVLNDDDNDNNNVQTFTFSSTKGAATQEGTDVQESKMSMVQQETCLVKKYCQLQDDFLHNRAQCQKPTNLNRSSVPRLVGDSSCGS